MKRSKLLKSVVTLVLFYMGLGMLAFFLMPPLQVYSMLEGLRGGFAKRVPELPAPEDITILDQLPLQLALVKAWTVPVLMLAFFALSFGVVCVLILIAFMRKNADVYVRKMPSYRRVQASIGEIPKPEVPPIIPRVVKLSGIKVTAEQQALADEMMGMLAAHQDAYAGGGHGVGLYTHTLNVCKEMLKRDDCTALMMLATIAHDLGKITKQGKDASGETVLLRGHAFESARLMASLESWWAMPEDERELLRLAVKYEHDPEMMPMINRPPRETIIELINAIRASDQVATKSEKAEVMKKAGDPLEIVAKAFDDALPQLPLRGRMSSKDVHFCGMRSKDRLYLFESFLREKVLAGYLAKDVSEAWEVKYREGNTLHPFTAALLTVLDDRGWLVTSTEVQDRPESPVSTISAGGPEKAMWTIWSGYRDKKSADSSWVGTYFNGVIIVDLPSDVADRAPEAKHDYTICVTRLSEASEQHSRHKEEAALAAMERSEKEALQAGKRIPSAPMSIVESSLAGALFIQPSTKVSKRRQRAEMLTSAVQQVAVAQQQTAAAGLGAGTKPAPQTGSPASNGTAGGETVKPKNSEKASEPQSLVPKTNQAPAGHHSEKSVNAKPPGNPAPHDPLKAKTSMPAVTVNKPVKGPSIKTMGNLKKIEGGSNGA